jgi:hypothetical protein
MDVEGVAPEMTATSEIAARRRRAKIAMGSAIAKQKSKGGKCHEAS